MHDESKLAVQSTCFESSSRYGSSWDPLPWVGFKGVFLGSLSLGLGERPRQKTSNRCADTQGDLGLDAAGRIVSSIAFPGKILEQEQISC